MSPTGPESTGPAGGAGLVCLLRVGRIDVRVPAGLSTSGAAHGHAEEERGACDRDIKTLGDIWEKAMPGTVSSPIWPI